MSLFQQRVNSALLCVASRGQIDTYSVIDEDKPFYNELVKRGNVFVQGNKYVYKYGILALTTDAKVPDWLEVMWKEDAEKRAERHRGYYLKTLSQE